jgi:uncharacterized protein YbjT (DUF2867 family)
MNILVIGATGTVGSRVVSGLIEKGRSVRGMTRSPEKAKAFPQGVAPVIADLDEPESLGDAFRGADAVFLLMALGPNETRQGQAAVEAAKKAKARKIVYMSVDQAPGTEQIPHFASKIPIEEAVKSSGLPWTLLRPNHFFQNDYWIREPITKYGVYPSPIGSGTSRVDVRDIADAAVNTLLNPGHAGQVYAIHGPEPLTGEDVAKAWTRHLGRDVVYTGNDLDAWQAQASQMLPAWMVRDLRIMFEFFQKQGLQPTPEQMTHAAGAIGHAPRRFDDFVAETAREWMRG